MAHASHACEEEEEQEQKPRFRLRREHRRQEQRARHPPALRGVTSVVRGARPVREPDRPWRGGGGARGRLDVVLRGEAREQQQPHQEAYSSGQHPATGKLPQRVDV